MEFWEVLRWTARKTAKLAVFVFKKINKPRTIKIGKIKLIVGAYILFTLTPGHRHLVIYAQPDTLSPAPQQAKIDEVKALPVKPVQTASEVSTVYVAPSPPPAPRVASSVAGGSHIDWMRAAGIAAGDFGYTEYIISHESGWDPYNLGPMTRYGQACHLEQTLPCGKDNCSVTNVVCQLSWFRNYCVSRYGSIYGAYIYWLNHHNY